ncbi:hypothetical protein [Neisseria meningitidis]|uniref:hypothetical protein n=1 Tax=Neisseria meningitidis TaxID=487 RepID=UPI0005E33950|nr:hypothetical protein [Neisseria meningitidis]CKL01340.1 Uncharacterised protein [Neisseria meningitidis]
MTKGCGNHGNGEVSDGIVKPPDGMQVSVWMILFLQISGNFYIVIPAQAGIYRHSRAGGNPGLWATAIFKDYPKV